MTGWLPTTPTIPPAKPITSNVDRLTLKIESNDVLSKSTPVTSGRANLQWSFSAASISIYHQSDRNREKNLQYAQEWKALHRGRGRMRKVAKSHRPVGLRDPLQPHPEPISQIATIGTLAHGFDKPARQWTKDGYPSDWTQEDIEFWYSQ